MARGGSSRGTRRSTMIRRGGEGFGARAGVWLRRIGIFCLVCLVLAGATVWAVIGDAVIQRRINQKFESVTARAGYKVENILVEGREFTDATQVLGIIGAEKGDPLFSVDPESIRTELEQISWIKVAHVERRMPDTVYVRLEERKPFALWERGRKDIVLIDQEGAVLSDKKLKPFKDLIFVRGKGAPGEVLDLARMLAAEPEIRSRLDYANRIEGRRWDLVLKGDKIVKLPEKDMGLAMRNLAVQHRKEGVLDKPLTILDVRDPERLIVRAEVGRAQDLAVAVAAQGQNL